MTAAVLRSQARTVPCTLLPRTCGDGIADMTLSASSTPATLCTLATQRAASAASFGSAAPERAVSTAAM